METETSIAVVAWLRRETGLEAHHLNQANAKVVTWTSIGWSESYQQTATCQALMNMLSWQSPPIWSMRNRNLERNSELGPSALWTRNEHYPIPITIHDSLEALRKWMRPSALLRADILTQKLFLTGFCMQLISPSLTGKKTLRDTQGWHLTMSKSCTSFDALALYRNRWLLGWKWISYVEHMT